MKNVRVEFNTSTYGIKSSTEELRRRWVKSPGFQRLLKKAANDKLRGRPVTLKASNPKALRALERAVYNVGVREFEIEIPEGIAARAVYLMKDGKAWAQVGKRAAVRAQKATTPDTLAVMPLWVYHPRISWAAARRLDAKTAPESISSMLEEVAPVEFSENRSRDTDRRGDTAQTEGRELSPWEEEAAEYNDAGELETRAERAEREQEESQAKEKQGVRIARERAAAAGKVFIPPTARRTPKATPRYFEYMHVWERTTPAPTPAVTHELPAAPWYHATEDAMKKVNRAEWEILCDERDAHQQRRAALDDDHNEQLECAELDELLSGEDLEADMLEPWEAVERFAALSTNTAENETTDDAGGDTPGVNVTRTFHADSGHGWLAVPHADLDALVVGELRGDSHYDDRFVYLEEDEDTGIYLRAAEQAGWTVDMKTEQIWADSFIRDLPGRVA